MEKKHSISLEFSYFFDIHKKISYCNSYKSFENVKIEIEAFKDMFSINLYKELLYQFESKYNDYLGQFVENEETLLMQLL